MKRFFLFCVFLAVVSCASVKKRDGDGIPQWVKETPVSRNCFYGVGSAKLSSPVNSKNASLLNAKSNLAIQMSSKVTHFSSSYASDTEGVTADAYQNLNVDSADVPMKNMKIEDVWTAPDGTVWTLVSSK